VPLIWNAGYFSWYTGNALYGSERIKHPQQAVGPRPANATGVKIDLLPGFSGTLYWVVPA